MKLFNDLFFDELVNQARTSPRRRANHNVHTEMAAPVQRLFIAIEPGSYVRPHRHPEKEKWEFFMVVRGRLVALFFDDQGQVLRREELNPGGPLDGFEIPPNTWHTVTALEPGSIFLEVKQGPYIPLGDKDFAAWAPAEGEPGCLEFVTWLTVARAGESAPTL